MWAGTRKRSDVIIFLIIVALAVFICQQSILIQIGSLQNPGPGLFPFCTGLGIGFLAVLYFLESTVLTKNEVEELQVNATFQKSGKLLTVSLSLFAYIFLVHWFGFVYVTFAFAVFFLRVVSPLSWSRIALTAFLITLGNYLIFVWWLDVNLPKGMW